MKTSQKGTRLNEVRYFRQPRPYTRMKITKTRLINDVPGLPGIIATPPKVQTPPSNHPRSCEKSRDRCLTLDRDQRSREIAFLSYASDASDPEASDPAESNYSRLVRCRDTSVETDPEDETLVWLPESSNCPPEVGKYSPSPTKFESEKEIQVELELQMEEKNIGVEESTKEFNVKAAPEPEVVVEPREKIPDDDRHEKTNVREKKNNSDGEKSFWTRYTGIRKILDFFGHLLGKRTTENRDENVATIDDDGNSLKKNFDDTFEECGSKKNEFSTNDRWKSSGKRKILSVGKNTTMEKPEVDVISGLAKRTMNDRDRRLRATLMKHEMRTRELEEENRRYRRMLAQKLRTRQMSNPLH